MIKLMIVDDEKLLRQGFIHMTDWAARGYRIVGEAADGEEALHLIEASRPDIVVTDIKMPGMDGVELIRRIKSSYPRMEVIALSSYSDFPYVKGSLTLGAADYILKASMDAEEVLAALDKAARRLAPAGAPSRPTGSGGAGSPKSGQARTDRNGSFYAGIRERTSPPGGRENTPDHISAPEGGRPNLAPQAVAKWNWADIRPFLETGQLSGLYERTRDEVVRQTHQGLPPSPSELQRILVELVYMLIHKLDEEGWNPAELHRRKWAFFQAIEAAGHFDGCMSALREALAEIADFLADSGYSIHKYSPAIKAVTQYLHRHYADHELSLGTAARKFHLNKSYLSQLFKQQTGVNFQSYLTRLRIEKAKLLLKKNGPVTEVCLEVGFDNVSYFSQLFKRWVGVSPSEYARGYAGD